MIPAVIGLASGTLLLLTRDEGPSPIAASESGLVSREHELKPPLGLTRKQWLGFLKVAICGKPWTVTPNFRLGTFGMSVRRLCDLGAMIEPRVIKYHGRQVWDADWYNPKDLRTFQASPMLQYDLFVNSIRDFHEGSEEETPWIQVKQAVGQEVGNGVKVTLSGALMLAHRAGLPGMTTWLADPDVRGKFADNTTAFFEKANGIF